MIRTVHLIRPPVLHCTSTRSARINLDIVHGRTVKGGCALLRQREKCTVALGLSRPQR
jgi:hypothetical protein